MPLADPPSPPPALMRPPSPAELRAMLGLRSAVVAAPAVPGVDDLRAALSKMLAAGSLPGGGQVAEPFSAVFQQYITTQWSYLLGVAGVG